MRNTKPTKEELAQLLREFPTWGHAAAYYKAENQRYAKALARISQHDGFPTSVPSWRDLAREALAGDTECVCGEINTRHCPVHGQGEALRSGQ